MPKLESKPTESLSKEKVLKLVSENVQAVEGNPTDYKLKREIVCKFFKEGKFPQCSNCIQHNDTVDSHTEWYLTYMKTNPALVWSGQIMNPVKRELVKADDFKEVGLKCDTCYLSDTCPLFQSNSLCAIDWSQSDMPRTAENLLNFLIERQLARVKRGSIIEEVDGGVPDANLSAEIDRMHGLIEAKADLTRDKFSLKIEGQAQNKGGSLLASIFGGAIGKNKPQEAIAEQSAEPVEKIEDAIVIKEPEKVVLKR